MHSFLQADLRFPFKAFSLPYEVKSIQWRPVQELPCHLMAVRSLSPSKMNGELMIVDVSKPIPDVYRHWYDYYAAAWSPNGLHVAALKRENKGR